MSISNRVFIRLRSKVKVSLHKDILLEDVAQVVAPEAIEESLKKTIIYRMTKKDGYLFVIDAIRIIKSIRHHFPTLEVQVMGTEETLIEVENLSKKRGSVISLIFVWLILFLGSGLAIMNFHTDVSMAEVHRRIYYLLTGEHNQYPFVLQIPYSLGIGAGMAIFFNHIFKKRLNEEPSPLEVEIFLYQENLEKYAKAYENQENRKEDDQ